MNALEAFFFGLAVSICAPIMVLGLGLHLGLRPYELGILVGVVAAHVGPRMGLWAAKKAKRR